MGYDKSWVSRNDSDHAPYQAVSRALALRNASAGPMGWQGGNGSQAGVAEGEEHGQEQTYRHFTTTVQIVIFVGSLLGKRALPEVSVGAICLSLRPGTADPVVVASIVCRISSSSFCVLSPQVYDFMFLVNF